MLQPAITTARPVVSREWGSIFLAGHRDACRKLKPESIYPAYLYPHSSTEESQQPGGDDNENASRVHWVCAPLGGKVALSTFRSCDLFSKKKKKKIKENKAPARILNICWCVCCRLEWKHVCGREHATHYHVNGPPVARVQQSAWRRRGGWRRLISGLLLLARTRTCWKCSHLIIRGRHRKCPAVAMGTGRRSRMVICLAAPPTAWREAPRKT